MNKDIIRQGPYLIASQNTIVIHNSLSIQQYMSVSYRVCRLFKPTRLLLVSSVRLLLLKYLWKVRITQ